MKKISRYTEIKGKAETPIWDTTVLHYSPFTFRCFFFASQALLFILWLNSILFPLASQFEKVIIWKLLKSFEKNNKSLGFKFWDYF